MTAPAILWFRRNLRLADNDAVVAAADSGRPVLPVYIHDPGGASGAANRWWLHYSLASLARDLERTGNRLLLCRGPVDVVLGDLARCSGAELLCYSRAYSPGEIAEQEALKARLDVHTCVVDDGYLNPPGTVLTAQGTPYKVFTSFWKACTALGEPRRPVPAPGRLAPAASSLLDELGRHPAHAGLADLGLLPVRPDWAGGLRTAWTPGETGATLRLAAFGAVCADYAEDRDRPDLDMTSRLSPHLHFGEISARQAWHAINDAAQSSGATRGAEAFLRQLYWRDFSGQLLAHFPDLPHAPLKPEFEHLPQAPDDDALHAWQHGMTGYPIVDAGMRELWTTGWMHNRVRMIVASFLVKNLMLPWQAGAAWFLDTLVDADLANNSASWQWVAGCGTDAAPYYRIFNPVLQGRKFDPEGHYVRRWIPELAGFPDDVVHEPWRSDPFTQRVSGIDIGSDYPAPIVDLAESRERALAAYQAMRGLVQSPAASPGSSAG